MSRKKYNTDIAKSQWDYVKKIIPQPKRHTKRNIDRKEILNAVFYIVRTGCQWGNLPHDFPNWKSVYNVFYQWRNDGTWKLIHDYLVHKIRRAVGKKTKLTAGIPKKNARSLSNCDTTILTHASCGVSKSFGFTPTTNSFLK